MRRVVLVSVLACAALAGCGSGEGNGGGAKGGDEAARAFIGCFKAPGYKAADPPDGQESLFAVEAERKGYPNTPVNVTEGEQIVASVFLVFFENGDKAKEALDEIGRETVGDIPPEQRGPAVLAYGSANDKAKTEKAIAACL